MVLGKLVGNTAEYGIELTGNVVSVYSGKFQEKRN